MDPYKDLIAYRLREYPRLSAVRLFAEIREAGYPGGYDLVKRYVREVRPRPVEEPAVRFETAPGRQGQVDFAQFRLPWGKRYALLLVLGYSRLLWFQFYARQTMAVLMRGLEAAFVYVGGVPWELLFDQMKAVIIEDQRAAAELFGELAPGTVIVCDRYSAYKRLVRLLGGTVTLAFCWAHLRRDFLHCAAGQVRLAPWCEAWLGRIAAIYRLNEARLARYDPGLERQSAAFAAAQDGLAAALDGLFAAAERELAGVAEHAREGKALRSLVNHREGLSVFAEHPRVPLDNNLAERLLRGPAIGRRLSFGSDSGTGARFTALMYSVVGTLNRNRMDVLRWLQGLAGRVRGPRRPAPGRPDSLAALVDGRAAPARTGGADMTDPIECRYYGRDFTAAEMALLRELIAGPPALSRHALSKEFCRRIGWYKTDGGFKDMMARVVMLAMHKDGRIQLPPPKGRQSRPGPIVFGPDTEPPLRPPPTTLDAVRPLTLRPVVGATREGRLWNEFVARYHYLGYTDPGRRPDALRRARPRRHPARHARLLHRRLDPRPPRPLHRLVAAVPREEPAARRRQPALPHPALDPHPQPRLPPPRPRPPPPARRLDRPLQHHPRADRDLRRDPPPHRRRLPRLRMDSRRRHPGPRPLRHQQPLRQAQKGHLAAPSPEELEGHPQPLDPTLIPARPNAYRYAFLSLLPRLGASPSRM